MDDKDNDLGIKTQEDNHNDGDKQYKTILAEHIVNTPRNKIAELTSLPLDQHRPHSLLSMLSDVLRNMCKEATQRQERLNIIYAKYHKSIIGTGKDKKEIGIIPVDLKTDTAWDIKKLGYTNLENWSFYYKQNRRGYKNELLMSMTTLAQSQLENEQTENPDEVMKRVFKDNN